ncbi:HD-GYP domain-containing protein (c-di-GMP phosphodiesterase class II) [Thermosipho japonicus]|uniref:HD-GYP domain-containing protein (C-di-GMP phosphodiesterase class II) n=1 Tax=Thermosipho japonicus TaxID=90323 RepID=A0A841GKM5_9BACT|nr:HD domain-containing phosphohydrolase [Thermosipho japonicus]MBB6062947.1 HD-GYP domain-containing protein (c-di-GMP phosphodiesterase class II) [Thermosipho japonicus]
MRNPKSLEKYIIHSFFLITTSFILVLSLFSIDYFHNKNFIKINKKIFNYLTIVDKVISKESNFESLIEPMKNLNYDFKSYLQAIEDYNNKKHGKEKLMAHVKDFKSFLEKTREEYETKHIKEFFKITLLLIFFGIITLILIWTRMITLKKYNSKLLKIFQKVSENINISTINIPKIDFKEEYQISDTLRKINLVQEIYNNINQLPLSSTIEDFVFNMGKYLCDLFNSDRFSVALIDWENQKIVAEVAYLKNKNIELHLKPGFSKKFNETSLGKMINENINSKIINDLPKYFEETHSPSIELILKEGFMSNLTVMLSMNNKPFGFIFLASKNKNNFTEHDEKLLLSISNILSYRFYYSIVTQNLLSNFGLGLVNLVEFKDNETGNHVKRVALYSKIIAEKLNLHPQIVREIYQFAPLHDIGKVGIPDSILLKPGKLTDSERQIIEKHVEIGVKVISKFIENSKNLIETSSAQVMLNIISDHHEKYDGTGYPKGKKGDEISIEGRIVALADVFDALTSKRPYKEPLDFNIVLEIIKKEKEKHFDPEVVNAFLSEIDKVRKVYEKLKD